MKLAVATLLLLACVASGEDKGSYRVGEPVSLECKSWDTGAWGPGPVCRETGKPLAFAFGLDSFLRCGLEVADSSSYALFREVVSLTKPWHCRVRVEPDGTHWAPLVIPVWGVLEGDHLHVDNHLHVVFHASGGRIIAAAAYPVKDRFQFVKPGSVISMHGAVRWFKKDTFTAMGGGTARGAAVAAGGAQADGDAAAAPLGCSPAVAAAWSAASAMLTFVGLALVYEQQLKPSIIRRCLKAR